MAEGQRLHGTSSMWDATQRVMLWNRIEFLRGKGRAEIRIAAIDDQEPRVIHVRDVMRVHLVGMIMDLFIECGGPDVTTTIAPPCPAGCEHGYVKDGDGNYERCPVCNG